MLRPHLPGVNHKRVYRLYSAAYLAVRKRKKAKRPASERVPLQLATTVNEVWSMDFVSDRPHSSWQRMPPSKFAELHRQRAGDAARSTSTTTEIN
ncbi:hypothetical protein ABIC89_002593 [Variovorax boronicumulans]